MSSSKSTVMTASSSTSIGGRGVRAAQAGRLGLGLALLSAATFSTAGSFARSLAESGWSPGAVVATRITVAAAILAIPTLFAMRGRWHAMRRNAGLILSYGVITVAGCQLFYFHAIQRLSVGVALLLEYLGIVLIVGWMWLRHGQRPHRLTVAGSLLAVLGLALVIDVLGDTRLDPIGVMWALAAAVGLAAYFVLSAQAGDDLPPIAIASGGMTVGAAVLLVLGVAGVLPMHASGGNVDFAGLRVSWLLPVAGLSVVAAAIAYVAGIGAIRLLGPRLSAFVGLTEVIFAVLVAWAVLGELPTLIQLVGGALILAGVALVRIDELRHSAPEITRPTVLAPTTGAAVTPRGAVT